MLLKFTHAFGNFEEGDEIEVADGAVFDHSYLELVPPADPPFIPPTPANGEE